VQTGPCTLANSNTCFRSPNYPSNYGINQQCTITAQVAVTLSVTAFSTEANGCQYDYLTVNGNKYCGTTGPGGVQVAAGATITWTSDNVDFFSGFEICSGGAFPPGERNQSSQRVPVAARDSPTLIPATHPFNLNLFDSAQCLMVRRWRLIGHFPILYNPCHASRLTHGVWIV
jgi:hypothetical protein